MNFSINEKSTLPILHMQLINDGRVNHSDFFECIQNADIKFSMWDVSTNKKIINCQKAFLTPLIDKNNPLREEYLISYKFKARETSKSGKYIGQFEIEFKDNIGNLILPIQDELNILIIKKSI